MSTLEVKKRWQLVQMQLYVCYDFVTLSLLCICLGPSNSICSKPYEVIVQTSSESLKSKTNDMATLQNSGEVG